MAGTHDSGRSATGGNEKSLSSPVTGLGALKNVLVKLS